MKRRLTLKKRMEERPETSYSNEDDDDGGGMKRKKSEGGKRIKSLMKMYRRKLQDEFEMRTPPRRRNRQNMRRTKHKEVSSYKSRTPIGPSTTTKLLERSITITGTQVRVRMIVQTV